MFREGRPRGQVNRLTLVDVDARGPAGSWKSSFPRKRFASVVWNR